MYGSIFHIRVKPGQEKRLIEMLHEWEQERGPRVKGALGSFLLKKDKQPGEYIGVAIFQDKASYQANANDPEQDRWYRRMRELLLQDPLWEDGEYVAAFMPEGIRTGA